MRKTPGHNSRDLMPDHSGAGKGDADRSPGWRDHYDEIEWGSGMRYPSDNCPVGFFPIGPKRYRKVYGATVRICLVDLAISGADVTVIK